ncbi:uncharacterized protein JN550_001888 [Neoarthrinium moseri]|uniref:uncharacterized protein n=1 Tax=Neoarthrinium moseri TaxID=1658444 RepID=UPI001FDDEF51|nr:uncharacterized protein JN550_001888 [Neoarthrinium moseri]KAI1875602.1 hypothetical protein JN550_001888 [Neoarthrinium moseri]
MESVAIKRTRHEDSSDNARGASDSKRTKSESPIDIVRAEERRRIEATYADLPLLPRRVPEPDFLMNGQEIYNKDDASLQFYPACAEGELDKMRSFVGHSRPPHSDLQYGLEKAAHGFQAEIIQYLMQERNVKLHTRVFETKCKMAPSPESIFTGGNPHY